MFCVKCGNQIADNARFCPKCGNQVAQRAASSASAPAAGQQAPSGAPTGASGVAAGSSASSGTTPGRNAAFAKGGSGWIALAVVQAVTALMGLLPQFTLRVPWVGGDYSLFDLMGALQTLGSYASLAGGGSEVSGGLGMLMVWVVVLIVVWLVGLGLSIASIVRTLKGSAIMASGSTLICLLGICCLATTMVAGGALSSMMGTNVSGVVSVSAWTWVMIVLSAAVAVACGYLKSVNNLK